MNTRIIVFFLSLMISAMPVFSHGLLFVPTSKAPYEDVYGFMRYIKEAHMQYAAAKGRDPQNWNELWPQMQSLAKGTVVLPEESCIRNGKLMTANALSGRKQIEVRYVMTTGKPWMVHTENAAELMNWIVRSNHDYPYRYFKDVKTEQAAIAEAAEKLTGKKLLGFDINMRRSSTLSTWYFHHADAFNALLPYLADQNETCYFRWSLVKLLKDQPDLYRFKDKQGRLEEIIRAEKKIKDETDTYRPNFIESLYELRKVINGVQ